MFSLKNKTALVIGGKGKIGLEVSCGLAEQGAKVIVASRNIKTSKDILKRFNALGIEIVKMDASIEAEVNFVVDKITETDGNIDILVNCSAWRPQTNFINDSVEDWENSIRVNSNAIFIP